MGQIQTKVVKYTFRIDYVESPPDNLQNLNRKLKSYNVHERKINKIIQQKYSTKGWFGRTVVRTRNVTIQKRLKDLPDELNNIISKYHDKWSKKEIIKNLNNNDFSMHQNDNDSNIDAYLVRNSNVLMERDLLVDKFYSLIPKRKIVSGDTTNTCLMKIIFGKIKLQIKNVINDLEINQLKFPESNIVFDKPSGEKEDGEEGEEGEEKVDGSWSEISKKELNKLKRDLVYYKDVISNDYGLLVPNEDGDLVSNNFQIHELDAGQIYNWSINNLYELLREKIHKKNNEKYVSVISFLFHIQMYLNIIETAILARIHERVRRHQSKWRGGWNAYYAALWVEYLKDYDDIYNEIDIMLEYCVKFPSLYANNLISKIDDILGKNEVYEEDIAYFKSFINSDFDKCGAKNMYSTLIHLFDTKDEATQGDVHS